jgi:SAM-dependent methyltransferase
MDSISRFTTKAERYAHYRWGYPQEAIQAILDITGLGLHAVVADIGSGTGLLTKEFVNRVAKIYAVEPNASMRQYAEKLLDQQPAFISVDGTAEATTLPDHSVDLITVGQAIHWFEPEAAFREFCRIIKPEGWLATLFHKVENQEFFEAVRPFSTVEYGWDPNPSPKPRYGDSHVDFYFGTGNGLKRHFPQVWRESWEIFLGAILSDSHSPDDTHPAFPKLVSALRGAFDHLSKDGYVEVLGGTELILGRLRED